MSEYALEITNLHKSFKLPTEKAGKLKTAVVNATKGIRGYKEQKVLKGIDFKVKKGEFFGIVGRNGSGKSTLLKIISQIYQPTKGAISVNGKLVPFIELGVGFNPELTGRENVYLNGALLGFSNKEIDSMYGEIVDFAELSEFMGQKLKNYSSGMQVRLAFSIAIKSQGDILILDEVLAVGDEAFQRKCTDYFSNLKKGGQTIVLVTHDMSVVERFCSKAILIEDGKLLKSDSPTKIARMYSDLLLDDTKTMEQQQDDTRFGTGEARIIKPRLEFSKDGKTATLSASINIERSIADKATFAYTIKDAMGTQLLGNRHALIELSAENQPHLDITVSIPNRLAAGTYFLDVCIYLPDRNIYVDCWIDALMFRSPLKSDYATPIIANDIFTEKKGAQ